MFLPVQKTMTAHCVTICATSKQHQVPQKEQPVGNTTYYLQEYLPCNLYTIYRPSIYKHSESYVMVCNKRQAFTDYCDPCI